MCWGGRVEEVEGMFVFSSGPAFVLERGIGHSLLGLGLVWERKSGTQDLSSVAKGVEVWKRVLCPGRSDWRPY